MIRNRFALLAGACALLTMAAVAPVVAAPRGLARVGYRSGAAYHRYWGGSSIGFYWGPSVGYYVPNYVPPADYYYGPTYVAPPVYTGPSVGISLGFGGGDYGGGRDYYRGGGGYVRGGSGYRYHSGSYRGGHGR